MEGWIKLYRQITEHWIWQERPFSKGQAWTDLILQSNHEKRKVVLGNELIEVNRGSFITSELKLMERWGWSKNKVRSFLELLQKDEMIVKNTDTKKTTISVLKYGLYQDNETTKEPQKDCKRTAKGLQKDTNKNEKNVKNIIKNIYGEYKHVLLTEKEIEKLNNDYGQDLTRQAITYLDEYIQMKDYKSKDHNLTIRKWVINAVKEKQQKPNPQGKPNKFNNFQQDKPDFNNILELMRKKEQKEKEAAQ